MNDPMIAEYRPKVSCVRSIGGVVSNAFWLKQSYSTPGPVSRGDRGTVEHFSIFGDTAAISMNLLIIYSVINIRPTLGNLTPRTCQ